MSVRIKLDAKNTKLLYELEKDSRKSISRLAKSIGVSKEVANYRIKKMLSSGFIRRFDSVIDYSLIGLDFYRLVINLHNLNYHIRKIIIGELKKMKKIDFNVYLMSDWDLEINLWVKNSKEFYEFYNNLMEKYAVYIKEKQVFLVTKIHLFNHSYIHEKRESVVIGGGRDDVKIDKKDHEILDILLRNPRESVVKIAEEAKLSPSTVNYKIKNLKKKKIFYKSVPVLNKNILGYNSFRVEITLNNPAKKNEVVSYLSKQDRVIKVYELLGNKDLDFYVDFETTSELDKFLEELRVNVKCIKDFEVINVILD